MLDFDSWVEKTFPHPEPARIPYVNLVAIYHEAMQRAQRDGAESVAVWGGNVCGRAAMDAARLGGIRVDYVVDHNPSIRQHRLGGAPIVSPDDIGTSVPLLPFVIGSLNWVERLQVEIRTRFNGQQGLKVYAPIPGRVPSSAARRDAPRHAAISKPALVCTT